MNEDGRISVHGLNIGETNVDHWLQDCYTMARDFFELECCLIRQF